MDDNNIFAIPANYTDSGKWLGGMVAPRNAIETLAFLITFGYLEYLIPMPGVAKVILMVVTLIPIAMISVMGIDGDSLGQYIGHITAHLLRRRKLHFRRPDDELQTK